MPEGYVLRWSGYEHEHIERGSDWFIALGVVTLCIAVVAILLNDALFAILVIMAAIIIAMLANIPPAITEFEISRRGIRVGRNLHRYEEIISFWVEDENEAAPMLLVDTTKIMSPNLVIPLEGVDAEEVRSFLKHHATEVPMKEPIAHKILEFFGF